MNRRLQTILDIEHITASQLADTLGIQRGGVSHLLSGRNKPSFDFLDRILRKFPEISAEWLITGQGKPIREDYSSTSPNTSGTILNNNGNKADIQSNVIQQSLFDMPYQESSGPKIENTPSTPPSSESKKPIRIIVYFSDGTYTEFYPFSVPSPSEQHY